MSDIQKLADRIATEFKPERIILFGSYAGGNPTPDSDVDMLVLAEHSYKNWEYATHIRNRIELSFPLDLIVRTPAQIELSLAQGDPFIREIVEQGEILYEAEHV